MEPNFSLRASHSVLAFWGPISHKRLTNIFLFEEETFLTRVKIVFGAKSSHSGVSSSSRHKRGHLRGMRKRKVCCTLWIVFPRQTMTTKRISNCMSNKPTHPAGKARR
ncbi:hypothetical protein SUGI_0090440 [Cryptomeria japonica]|nr:hypothetical protein SUGI_0090440 [Cryptomeria japonica]